MAMGDPALCAIPGQAILGSGSGSSPATQGPHLTSQNRGDHILCPPHPGAVRDRMPSVPNAAKEKIQQVLGDDIAEGLKIMEKWKS